MGPQSIVPPQPRIPALLLIALCLLLLPPQSPAQSTVAATTIPLILPSAIVFDPQGNLYFAETANHVIRKVDTTGIITTIAGTGTQGFSGDAGPATAARLDSPQGLALDANQNLYIADTHNHRIRTLTPTTATITTIPHPPTPHFSRHTHPTPPTAPPTFPPAPTTDRRATPSPADPHTPRIRRIDATTGIITTVAGQGTQTYAGDAGPATAASLDTPRNTTVSPTGLVT